MLREILEEREDAIVEQWLDCVLAAYPADGGAVFKRRTDRFANPVGSTARAGTRALFRGLRSGGSDLKELAAHLEGTLRIRAVQSMPASTAVGFILDLKRVVRAELKRHGMLGADPTELRAFEDRVDRLALIGFDVYTHCREEIAQLKIREAQRKVSWIVDRLNGATGEDHGADHRVPLPVVEDSRKRGGVSR